MPEASLSPGVTTATFKTLAPTLGIAGAPWETGGAPFVPLYWVAVDERAWPGQSHWGQTLPGRAGVLSQVVTA